MSRRIRCSVCGQMHNKEEINKITGRTYICNSCLENDDCEYFKCAKCGKIHNKIIRTTIEMPYGEEETIPNPNFVNVNDGLVCIRCYNYYYTVCEVCNKIILKKDVIEAIDGSFCCEECINENFKVCPKCGYTRRKDCFIHIEDTDQEVCDRCAPNYFNYCSGCNKYYSTNISMTRADSGDRICPTCLENNDYTICSDCGVIILRQIPYTDEETEQPLCGRCYNRLYNYQIRSYHDQSEPFVKRNTENDKQNESFYFGLELEVSGRREVAGRFYRKVKNDVILMSDSSIIGGGFEIVTMPMTVNYFNEVFKQKLTEGLKVLIQEDFKGHNCGGLHIHVSEDVIDKDQLAQLSEVLYGSKNDIETWLQITQRKRSQIDSYSSMTNKMSFYNILESNYEKPPVSTGRYTALNHSTRTHTYEFRIFNSNLRIERILKNIQCVFALLDYSKNYAKNERPVCNTTEFLKFVMSRAIFYPELAQFIKEKNILEQHLNKQFNEMPDVADEERETACA